MTEKIKLTKSQAEAVEELHLINKSDKRLVARSYLSSYDKFTGSLEPLNDLDFDDIMGALYIGYEIEKTPEDHVLQLYNSFSSIPGLGDSYHATGVQEGITCTLNILGIKIKGIND